jgi:hypothetical protein
MTTEAFQTLESLNDFLLKHDRGTASHPRMPSEDPFYVAGLMCSHGRWHADQHLDVAIAWFRRSLERGDGLQYQGPILGAIGLCLHRLRRTPTACEAYESCRAKLREELAQEFANSEPVFHDDLQQQIELFTTQQSRLAAGDPPSAVMTRYGWAVNAANDYRYWQPWGNKRAANT